MRPAAGGLAVAVIAGLVLAQGQPATAQSARVPTSNVTAYAADGSVLPADPAVRYGATIRLVVTGFAPGAMVTVHQPPRRDASHPADGAGTLVMEFVVPHGAPNGDYEMTFSGYPVLSSPTATQTPNVDGGDPQTVTVLVPEIGLFPFRIADPGGTSSPTASVSATSSSVGGGNGPPASTGSDLARGLLVAFAALSLGVLIAVAGRRPRHAGADVP